MSELSKWDVKQNKRQNTRKERYGLHKPMKTVAPASEIKLWATVLNLAANHEAHKQRGKGVINRQEQAGGKTVC